MSDQCCDRWGTVTATLNNNGDDPTCRCPCCHARRWDRTPPKDRNPNDRP